MESRVYAFLLDFFPLTDAVMQENVVLGELLQRTAVEALFAANASPPHLEKLDRLRLLLRLANDLGYIDNDVQHFLQKELHHMVDDVSREAV